MAIIRLLSVEIIGIYPALPPNSLPILQVSPMKSTALLVLAIVGLLTACTSARDELLQTSVNKASVPHNTIVDCPCTTA